MKSVNYLKGEEKTKSEIYKDNLLEERLCILLNKRRFFSLVVTECLFWSIWYNLRRLQKSFPDRIYANVLGFWACEPSHWIVSIRYSNKLQKKKNNLKVVIKKQKTLTKKKTLQLLAERLTKDKLCSVCLFSSYIMALLYCNIWLYFKKGPPFRSKW